MAAIFNSLLGKLRAPSQQSTTSTCPAWLSQDPSYQEEDGFLMVGQTASEQSTVPPQPISHTGCTWSDAPPSYEAEVQRTASYDPSSQSAPGGPWSSRVSSVRTSPADSPVAAKSVSDGSSSGYAAVMVADIPFQLSEGLNCAQKLSLDTNYFAVPRLHGYDPDKYVYDFEFERRVIEEAADFNE